MSTPVGRHDPLRPAQEVSERALEASRSTECMVIITDVYEANVRYANNTATTNGVKRDRRRECHQPGRRPRRLRSGDGQPQRRRPGN